jgi:AbrB family looped-hinge helix DNA binding protein
MKPKNGMNCQGFSEAFYGSSTVGERGQIVIPAEARAEIGFHPGDKVLIMRHPAHSGLMIFKIDSVREFLDDFAKCLSELEEAPEATREEDKNL